MVAKHGFRRVVFGIGGTLIAVAGTAGTASAQSVSTGDQYSGRAYAVGVIGATLAGSAIPDQVIGDTGQLPSGGGTVTFGAGTVTVPSLATATIVTEQATGSNGTSSASSDVSNLVIGPGAAAGGKDLVDATLLTANTAVNCAGQQTLASSVATLTIAGNTVAIPPNPNTTVRVLPSPLALLANVTFRQQSYVTATNTASASALVISFPTAAAGGTLAALITGTITISHAESDLHCPPFTVSKTANGASSATVTAGSDVTYGVTLTNQVNTACLLDSVSDSLPPQPGEGGVPFTYVSGGPTGGTAGQSTTSGAQNVVTWTFASPPSIAVGGTFSFDFVAHVPSNEPPGTYLNVVRYTSTCGPGSGTTETNFTSGGLAPVTVVSAVPPVPSSGSGLPTLTLPLGLGILGAALTAGGIVDVVGRRRTARGTPPIE